MKRNYVIQHRKVLILKSFRNGLNISQREIGEALFFSSSLISSYELGDVKIIEEKVRLYSGIIAKRLGFDEDAFYQLIEKEAYNLVDDSVSNLINVVSRIICCYLENFQRIEPEQNYDNKKVFGSLGSKICAILSCIRRISSISLEDANNAMFYAASMHLSKRELGKVNASEKYAKDYARFIAQSMGYDFNKFYRYLIIEAAWMSDYLENVFANGMIGFAKVIKSLNS